MLVSIECFVSANALYKPPGFIPSTDSNSGLSAAATTQLKTSKQLILGKFTADECTEAAARMKLGQLGAFVHQSLKLAYSLGQEADIVSMRITEHVEEICKQYVKLVQGTDHLQLLAACPVWRRSWTKHCSTKQTWKPCNAPFLC